MKKSIFLSIVAAIAVAMTFVSCGSKEEVKDTIEPITGTDYSLVTTAKGELGIKKGEEFIVNPSSNYKAIEAIGGMFLAKTEGGYSLLDLENGQEKVSGDTIIWKDGFFEAPKGELFIVYIPECDLRFAANEYAVKENNALAAFNGKITVYLDGKEALPATGDFKKIALVGDQLYLFAKAWGKGTIKNGAVVPGKSLTAKELKAFQAKKGFDKKATVMILE